MRACFPHEDVVHVRHPHTEMFGDMACGTHLCTILQLPISFVGRTDTLAAAPSRALGRRCAHSPRVGPDKLRKDKLSQRSVNVPCGVTTAMEVMQFRKCCRTPNLNDVTWDQCLSDLLKICTFNTGCRFGISHQSFATACRRWRVFCSSGYLGGDVRKKDKNTLTCSPDTEGRRSFP